VLSAAHHRQPPSILAIGGPSDADGREITLDTR
jgi:hypothetical protein